MVFSIVLLCCIVLISHSIAVQFQYVFKTKDKIGEEMHVQVVVILGLCVYGWMNSIECHLIIMVLWNVSDFKLTIADHLRSSFVITDQRCGQIALLSPMSMEVWRYL